MQRTAHAAETGTPPRRKRTAPAASRARRRRPATSHGCDLARSHDPIELCRLVYQTVGQRMDATTFLLGLHDAASGTVDVVWQVENGKELSGGSFPLDTRLSNRVLLTGQPLLMHHWSGGAARGGVALSSESPAVPESAVAVPLKLGERTIGLISVQSYRRNAYDLEDVRLLEDCAREAAVVIAGLQYSEHRSELEGVLSSMAEALLMIDRDGSPVRLNRAARELLGLDDNSRLLGHAFGESRWDQWPAPGQAVAQALRPIAERLHETRQPQEVEVELPPPSCHILSVRATPLSYVDGIYNGGVILFRDITAQRMMERFNDEMFSVASHDLKTPATAIKAQAQWLKRQFDAGGAARDELQDGLTMIANQADRLARLLNVMLDVSRIEGGHLQLELTPVDAGAILVSMAQALQATTDSHVIELEAPPGVSGDWDQRRIEQVVQNLLHNAIKYSPAGGRVQVRLASDASSATVSVTDSGKGLAPEDAPHIFERFYRGRTDRRLEGTGLGLYICQAIVSAHGGTIWAESNGVGRGSTFAFRLPLRAPAGN